MTARSRARSWSIRIVALVALALLWWLTAHEDEAALWRRYNFTTAATNIAISALVLAAAYILCSPDRWKIRAGRLALVAFSLLVTFGGLELPAWLLGHDYGRTLGTVANDTWLQLATGVNRRDEALIHVHQPHTRYRGIVRGSLVWLGIPGAAHYAVDVAYDKNGFRNDEDFTEVRVAAIGDSFVEGAEVSQEQTMVAHLRRRLGVTVANLGQSSYGPQQELVVLERYGAPLRPKVVVWFFFGGNDLDDADVYEWRRSHLDEYLAPRSLVARSFTRNALWALARATTQDRRQPSATALNQTAEFTRRDGSTETIYLDANEDEWEPRTWQIASDTLARASVVTKRMDAALLIVYIPRKLRVYQGFLHAEPGTAANTWKNNNLPQVLGSWCKDRGIEFLDSTVPLRSAVASGESVYLPDDTHWNAAGHRVVAEAVAGRLLKMGRLRAPATPGY